MDPNHSRIFAQLTHFRIRRRVRAPRAGAGLVGSVGWVVSGPLFRRRDACSRSEVGRRQPLLGGGSGFWDSSRMPDPTGPQSHAAAGGSHHGDMPQAPSLQDMRSLEQRLRRLHRQHLPITTITDPSPDPSSPVPAPMHEAETVEALAEGAGSWAPLVWRSMGMPMAEIMADETAPDHDGGVDRQPEEPGCRAQLQLRAWSCAELMASLLAGHPSITGLLAQGRILSWASPVVRL